MNRQKAPIGVFDSGLGGLTAVKELRALLPGEDIIYYGDTGRVPYGSRGRDIIIAYTRQDIAFLLSKGVKTIIAACGTASSTYPKEEGEALPVRYAGVVEAAAAAAAGATKNGRVGVIATEATIRSGSYQAALSRLDPTLHSTAQACPLFVPLVENGHFAPGDEMARLAAQEYLGGVRAAGVDTVIMGCTHYPLLAGVLGQYFGPAVTLVDPGREAALELRGWLTQHHLLSGRTEGGRVEYYVSDDPARFEGPARLFLGRQEAVKATRINIEEYCLQK